jgi:light-regulated signal transduction histidine kinase (bacteriophytochrome)
MGEELQLELRERKRPRQELCDLNRELETRLFECRTQLAAAQEQCSIASLQLAEDRREIDLLNQHLQQHKRDYETVSQELEALSFSISHDLKAPLRHLLGFSGALQEDYGDILDPGAQSFLGCISKAAHKMDSQIEALLGLSRIARQKLSVASVDLSRMVRDSAALLQGGAPGRRAVFTIADQILVRADAELLRAAIDKLLENAWKFTMGREAAAIEFGQKREGDSEVFFLRDNGAGFDMRYADRLFGAFQRMHKESEFEGTGIGLATVQRIIHRHGGRIWADAAVDEGATFFFTLEG